MRTLNLGILAHVDAGKTTLSERLLYAAGIVAEMGSVDAGTTTTDSLELERARGITIRAAVVSYVTNDLTINLIDTPGHPDFIAEVERVLGVLDGAVLVVSAVEGVQPQTRILMRTLVRLRIPTIIFVNKIDRSGADTSRVLHGIRTRLGIAALPMGNVEAIGTKDASFTTYTRSDPTFVAALTEHLAERDEAILAAWADGGAPDYDTCRSALCALTRSADLHPVYCGSAMTGAGIDSLTEALGEFLPAAAGDSNAPASGVVFKIERGEAGERIAYVRLFAGTLRVRTRVPIGADPRFRVTAIHVFANGSAEPRDSAHAGEIVRLHGLGEVRIGDVVGVRRNTVTGSQFAPPTLETAVVPRRRDRRAGMHRALAQLAEQDPLIDLRQDDLRQEVYLSLYGEVQKEVIQQTLKIDYGIDVEFRQTVPLCIERPVGTGTALETAPRPFVATVGLRIDPAPVGSGVQTILEIPYGVLPVSFHKAVDVTLTETLRQGLHGWPVTDCRVAITHFVRLRDFAASTAAEHRLLTPLVLMTALERAGTVVCEPVQRIHLEFPGAALALVLRTLAVLGATLHATTPRGDVCVVEGDLTAARVPELQKALPSLAHGEGVLECSFGGYRPVRGPPPSRARTDFNPLNRKEYLMHVKGHAHMREDER